MSKNHRDSHRVPWEPYRGAINAERLRDKAARTVNKSAATVNEIGTLSSNSASSHQLSSFDMEDLVRYKVDTDLNLFNAQRPGYLFDASDYERIDKLAFAETDMSKLIPTSSTMTTNDETSRPPMTPFVDARFYTDFHFLKLANELKKKCVPPSAGKNGPQPLVKPVNVVGPMLDKKAKPAETLEPPPASNSTANGLQASLPTSASFDSNSAKIWKSQRSQYESRIDYLESQITGLNEQLQIQTQVNAELKRMLVASVGEDMQYRLERLANDKQRLEFELVSNNANLDRMSDEIEQVSIQCDLWRSKFLASKLMLDELSTWKSFLLLLNRENENVLTNLLNDNKIINDKLLRANDLLMSLSRQNEMLKESSLHRYNSIQLANSILNQLSLMNIPPPTEKRNYERLRQDKKESVKFKTNNEQVAEQMLEQFEWLSKCVLCPSKQDAGTEAGHVDSLDKLEDLINRIKLKRSSTHSRLFQAACTSESYLLLNVCNQCTGQLKVV